MVSLASSHKYRLPNTLTPASEAGANALWAQTIARRPETTTLGVLAVIFCFFFFDG